jgi:hypothetical protein
MTKGSSSLLVLACRRCPFSNRRDLAIFSEQAKGDGEMKGWKWAGKLRVQIWIIVVLVFIIWIVLQKQYY